MSESPINTIVMVRIVHFSVGVEGSDLRIADRWRIEGFGDVD